MAAYDEATPQDIVVHLDDLLAARGMTLTDLSAQVGVTVVNLSILKNGRAKAIRFSTLTRLCQILSCQPGDILSYQHLGSEPQNNANPANPKDS